MSTTPTTTSTTNPDAQMEAEIRWAIDSIIDSSESKLEIDLESIKTRLDRSSFKKYIVAQDTTLERFLTARRHYWQVRRDDSSVDRKFVRKQSAELRSALYRLIKFVGEHPRDGVMLRQIAEWLDENCPTAVAKEFGAKAEAMKTYLKDYFFLFEISSQNYQDGRNTTISTSHLRYITKARAIDDAQVGRVILLPERLNGQGRIEYFMKEKAGGIIRDGTKWTKADQRSYFPMASIQTLWATTVDDVQKWTNDGRRFEFEAVRSTQYQLGLSKYKWKVIRMWLTSDADAAERGEKTTKKETESQDLDVELNDGSMAMASAKKPQCSEFNVAQEHPIDVGIQNPPQNVVDEIKNDQDQNIDHEYYRSPINIDQLPSPPGFDEFLPTTERMPSEILHLSKEFGVDLPDGSDGHRGGGVTIPRTREDQDPAAMGSSNMSRKSAIKEKRDASSQTEFDDDHELLLKLFRQSPEIMNLIKKLLEPMNN